MVDTPLLTTKIGVPPLRLNLVPRPRLIRKLNASLHRASRLVLVSAPAGFGKTTLLSGWIHDLKTVPDGESAFPVGWLSVDEGDNDPLRFLAYLITALQAVHRELGQGLLAALQSPRSPPIETILTVLINEISSVPGRSMLVLDDLHLIKAAQVHAALGFLLEHLPPPPDGMQMVIATRADPPWPLARLRSRASMIELRIEDLRFQPAEADDFLNGVMGLKLTPEQVAELEARTEGWIAGLQLAGLALQPLVGSEKAHTGDPLRRPFVGGDASEFIQSFAGDERYIIDYLVEEVLRHQPPALRSFLLKTSVLERLSGSLCDAVTGQTGSQATLETLESDGLFLVALDGKRIWYRYHQLFRDVLQHYLVQEWPDRVADLHSRASQWHERSGLIIQAVDHALAAGEMEAAADLIQATAWSLQSQGGVATLLRWFELLPEQVIHDRSELALLYGWALIGTMRLDAIEPHLLALEERFRAAEAGLRADLPSTSQGQAVKGEIAAIRGTVASMKGDSRAAIRRCGEALAALPDDHLLLRGIVANTLGAAYDAEGESVAASQAFTEAAQLSRAADNPLIALIALGNLARLQETQGYLRQAAETCRNALDLAAQQGDVIPPAAGMAHLQLGRLLCEWNDLEAASQHLQTGIEMGQRAGIAELAVAGLASLARVRQAQADPRGALDVIAAAERLVRQYDVSAGLKGYLAASRAELLTRQGNWQEAAQWARELGLRPEDEPEPGLYAEYIPLARTLLAGRRLDEVTLLLERLLAQAQSQARPGRAVELLVLQALAFHARGEVEEANAALARALATAKPEGYARVFLEAGPAMAELLRVAVERETEAEYAAALLAALERETRVPRGPLVGRERTPPMLLIEPLSERELEVLHLLQAGLTNQEIADRLVITVGTTKWHLHNIYSKLGVHNRTLAVARARELGL